MTVRNHLPWPVRWVVGAVVLGFCGALALWAFEFGKGIAGLDRGAKQELAALRVEVTKLRDERERAQSIANTAESLLRAEKAAQTELALQVRQVEAENMSLKADLGFFERLLPASGASEGLAVRSFQVEQEAPGQLRYQLLVMQSGKQPQPFNGRYDLTLSGLQDGKPWALNLAGGAQPLQIKQYGRVEGRVEHPLQAVVKTVQVRVTDSSGAVRATQTARL